MWCGAVRCRALRCRAVRCGVVRCGVVRCGALRCAALRCVQFANFGVGRPSVSAGNVAVERGRKRVAAELKQAVELK